MDQQEIYWTFCIHLFLFSRMIAAAWAAILTLLILVATCLLTLASLFVSCLLLAFLVHLPEFDLTP